METLKRTIKAVSLGRIEDGSIGFVTTDVKDVGENEKTLWFNVIGETDILHELVKNVVSKGNKIEFEYNNGVVGSLKLIEKAPEIKPSFQDQLERVNYKTLMAEAHRIGLISTKVELCPELTDFAKKTATFKATVVIKQDGPEQTFEDFGEACGLSKQDGGNIDQESIKCAWIRMASTRALVRALRQATNNMEVADEELPSGKTN